jgi:broad specificity phosphatase PhoE
MTLIYLIRHGRPASDWGGGEVDPPLAAEGRLQARTVARKLAGLSGSQRPIAVASSPMRRCRETARPLAEALGVEVVLAEGVGEIPTPSSLSEKSRGGWLRGALAGDWRDIVGDRDYEAWRRNVAKAVAERPGQAIFTHFVAMNAVISLLEGAEAVTVFRPGHASVTVLECIDGDLSVVSRGGEARTGVL